MSETVPDPKNRDFHDILRLAEEPRYKGRPLSIAVKLGLSWRYVYRTLNARSMLANAEAYNDSDNNAGLSENFYVS